MSYAGVDNQYDSIPTNCSYFSSPAIPKNVPGYPLEVIEQSGVAFKDTLGLGVTDYTDHPNSMLARSSDFDTNNQFRLQSSVHNPTSGQPSTYPAPFGSLHRQLPGSSQPALVWSLIHQNQSNETPVMDNAPTRKRRRSPGTTLEQRMSTTRKQLSKQTGVPETFLGTMWCSEPAPKQSRTNSQRQNKKDVMNAGGACFLCLVLKRKVYPFESSSLPGPLFTEFVVVLE